MDIMPGGAASGEGGGGGRLLPLVYDQLRSLQGADRRVSEGTLQSATRRAQRSHTAELGTFLAGLRTSLAGDDYVAAAAAVTTAPSASTTTGGLSPQLVTEVVSVLDRVRSSLRTRCSDDGGGGSDGGGGGGGEKSAELLQLVDRLQSELKTMVPQRKEPPPVPPRRAAMLRRLRRPHTIGITRDELIQIRRNLEASRQQQKQNQQGNTPLFSPTVASHPPQPLPRTRVEKPQQPIIISPLHHAQSPITNDSEVSRSPGEISHTFYMTSDLPSGLAPAQEHLDTSSQPCPPPRLTHRKDRHTIGSSKDDFTAIRTALNAAITPPPSVMHNQMPESAGNVLGETLETQEVLVPQKATVHGSHRQFARQSGSLVQHRSDAGRPPPVNHTGLQTPESRSNSQSPRPSLAAVLTKQMTKEYLEDSTNISRDQVIDSRLSSHKAIRRQNSVTEDSASPPKNPNPPQPVHRHAAQTGHPVSGQWSSVLETTSSPAQYTCSIVTQETQTAELPSSSHTPETKSVTPSRDSRPIWARQRTPSHTASAAVSSKAPGGSQPVWARKSRPAGRLSLDGSLRVPGPGSSQPVWSCHTSTDTSPVGGQHPWTRKEMSHSKTASESSTLSSDEGHSPLIIKERIVSPSRQENISLYQTGSGKQHVPLYTPAASTSQNTVDPSQQNGGGSVGLPEMLSSQLSDSSHLPWTQQGRSDVPASSVSRIANAFGSASLDSAPPTLARQSRLEKTRSLYSTPSVDHKATTQNTENSELALLRRHNFQQHHHQRPILSSGGQVTKHRNALERSKSEEHIGEKQHLAESMRQEQLKRYEKMQQQWMHFNTTQKQKEIDERSSYRPGISQQNYQLGGLQAQAYQQHPSLTCENMSLPQNSPSNQHQQQQQAHQHSVQYPEKNLPVQQGFQPHPPVQSQTHHKLRHAQQLQHTLYNPLLRQEYISKQNIENSASGREFIPVTANEDGPTVETSRPLWAKSGSGGQGKVKQRAATLDEAPPTELLHQPKSPHQTRRASDIISRPLSCESGPVHLKSYHGPITAQSLVARSRFDGTVDSSPTSPPSLSSWVPSNQPFDLRTAPLARSPLPAEHQPAPVRLPPQYPRPPPHRPSDLVHRDATSACGAARSRPLGPLQRSSSSDMLRFGVTTKPFEAHLDVASAEQKKQRLQTFFKEREEEREDKRLARSFEDLLDGLDEEDLPPVKSGGGGGGGKSSFAAVGSMPHALAKSATVGDLRPSQRAASTHERGMFARKQRAWENTIGTSMAVGMGSSTTAHGVKGARSGGSNRSKISEDTLDLVRKYFAKEGM